MDELLRQYIDSVLNFYFDDCTNIDENKFMGILNTIQNDNEFKEQIYELVLEYADKLSS